MLKLLVLICGKNFHFNKSLKNSKDDGVKLQKMFGNVGDPINTH